MIGKWRAARGFMDLVLASTGSRGQPFIKYQIDDLAPILKRVFGQPPPRYLTYFKSFAAERFSGFMCVWVGNTTSTLEFSRPDGAAGQGRLQRQVRTGAWAMCFG